MRYLASIAIAMLAIGSAHAESTAAPPKPHAWDPTEQLSEDTIHAATVQQLTATWRALWAVYSVQPRSERGVNMADETNAAPAHWIDKNIGRIGEEFRRRHIAPPDHTFPHDDFTSAQRSR